MHKLICILLMMAAGTVLADDKVYRYTDESGVIHYTDKPPSKDAKPTVLPKLQTFKPSSSGGSSHPAAPAPLPAKTQFSLAIDSPTPDQTYRSPGAGVNVSVSILPALINGYGLIYSVDGMPQNDTPSAQTSYTISGLERGSHIISVTLVGPKREEVAGNSVSVHMMPPSVKKK